MFEKVISHLRSEIKTWKEIAEDKTGVVTNYTKVEAAKIAKEFESSIIVLRLRSETASIQLSNEICSSNPCDYCIRGKDCPVQVECHAGLTPETQLSLFEGRKIMLPLSEAAIQELTAISEKLDYTTQACVGSDIRVWISKFGKV